MKLDGVYWDKIAKAPFHLDPQIARYKREEHIRLIQKWVDLSGKTVLKTDCYEEAKGQDYFLDWLSKKSKLATGMDISPYLISMAQKKFKRLSFVTEDVRKLTFKSKSFDIIISNSTLDHFPTSDLRLALKEFHRVLKKNGTLILTLDNKDNPFYHTGYLINNLINTNPYHQEKCYSLKETTKLAEEAGFKVKDSTSIVHVITPFNKIAKMLPRNMLFSYFVKMSLNIFKKLETFPTRLRTGWFIAVLCTK